MALPAWVWDLRDRIPSILESCSAGPPGWYRLCTEGDLLRPGPRAGLGLSCYAAKVMVECGLWGSLSEEHRAAWIRHIQGFQLTPEHPGHGMFRDPWVEWFGRPLYTFSCLRTRRWRDLFRTNWQNRWAETRQAVSTLAAVGARPLYPISGFPVEPGAIRAFLERLDWQHPWGAGAQAGHLLFFLKHGQVAAGERDAALEAVLDSLADLEVRETGGWYRGNVANQEILNGAMKVISGLFWWGIPVHYAQALARSAVAETSAEHDCALANRLFVLYRLGRQLGRAPEGTTDIVGASLRLVPGFVQADGGLSSTPSGSLRVYYYAPVSLGKPVGDLHGLTLLSWSITLGAHLVGQGSTLGWRPVAP